MSAFTIDWLIDWFLVFNAIFSNILATVLVVEEAGVRGENHRPRWMGPNLEHKRTEGYVIVI
jgi:hypothetical protein